MDTDKSKSESHTKKPVLGILIPTLGRGGAERIVCELGMALSEWEPFLLTFDPTTEYPWSGKRAVLGINLDSARNRATKAWSTLRGALRLGVYKRTFGIDATLSLLPLPNILNILTSTGKPTVVSVHNTMSKSLGGQTAPVMRKLIRHLYPKATCIVAVSEGVKQDLVSNFDIDEALIKVIYNPVSVDQVLRLREQKLPDPYETLYRQRKIISSVGRLTTQKGFDILIEAFRRYLTQEPEENSVLCITGRGPDHDKLVALSRSIGLRTWTSVTDPPSNLDTGTVQVVFAGAQSNPFPFMARSQAFVLSSRWEGFGIVLIEALACEVPIIASDCWSGPREVLTSSTWRPELIADGHQVGEYGLLTTPHDEASANHSIAINSLTEAMTTLRQNKGLQHRLRETSLERSMIFNTATSVANWEALLSAAGQAIQQCAKIAETDQGVGERKDD